jgi:hypothetical protein
MGLCLTACLTACATRDVAYRFRAPLLSSVHAAPLPDRAAPATPATIDAQRPHSSMLRARIADLPAPHRSETTAMLSMLETELDATPNSDPTPAHTPDSTDTPAAGGVVEILRGMVGQRDKDRSHVQFALLALETIGVDLGADPRGHKTGAELLAWAESKDALSISSPLPGDLVMFDKVNDGQPASLVGVVVEVIPHDREHTVEFVYLARGVVRRGYVSPQSPASKRNPSGRALNTFVRHLDGNTPRSAEFLAGELFRTYLRIDRLAR